MTRSSGPALGANNFGPSLPTLALSPLRGEGILGGQQFVCDDPCSFFLLVPWAGIGLDGRAAMAVPDLNPSPGGPGGMFTTTHWSVVLAAAQQSSPESTEALAELCRAYWYPLYSYVRRKGYEVADAQDLTQEFFARFLARHYLGSTDRRKGKFRS